MMLTRAEIGERLKRLTALGAMSTEAHALETAQQLYERLAQAEKVVEAAKAERDEDWDCNTCGGGIAEGCLADCAHVRMSAALAAWEGK